MPATDTPNSTPLAPSVEKAYYRKCIQLKRRLNEVESANEEAKIKRLRLDRAIMKMRLERAFLLDELRKRMDVNVEGSDASADEGMATPPPDRPHRDKRRRPNHIPSQSQPSQPSFGPPASRTSDPHAPSGPQEQTAANSTNEDGRYAFVNSAGPPTQPSALSHGSPYGPPPTGLPSGGMAGHVNGLDGASERDSVSISRQSGTIGEPVGVGPSVVEDNGERKTIPPTTESANAESPHQGRPRSGFNAVNN